MNIKIENVNDDLNKTEFINFKELFETLIILNDIK